MFISINTFIDNYVICVKFEISANNMALMKSLVKIMYLRIHRSRVKYEICENDEQANRYGDYGIIYHPLIHTNID